MDATEKLAEFFREFPGIGPRQAKRFVYFLLTRNNTYLNEFSDLIKELKRHIRLCASCYRFYPEDASGSSICNVCRDPNRDISKLMIVSKDVDFESIERSHSYKGRYFILGGTVPILEKNPESRVRGKELVAKIENECFEGGLKEVILAMNLNPEGENTEEYVRRILNNLITTNNIKVSILGRGLSTGTELEYSDSETIKNALKNRF